MKQKTKKAARKRFTVSSRGKAMHRAVNQAHFNGKESGQEGRQKHRPVGIGSADTHRLTTLLPYNPAILK